MPLDQIWPVPFLINPQNLEVDALVSFAVSVLLAVMINAEAQAFVASFLGDSRINAKDRFHFNAFLHVSVLGTICYAVGGFGWPRTMDIDPSKFKRPRAYTVLVRLAGPMANLLLASIGGSLVMVMNMLTWNPRVFLMVMGVNITTAVYNLIPIPPLVGGVFLSAWIPKNFDKYRSWFEQIGPYLIVALVLLGRLRGELPFGGYLDPLVVRILDIVKG
jgi:Zn-dependent protease